MSEISLKVQFDDKQVIARLKKNIEICQKVLDAQVLKDSNYFCPMYTGVLMKSGILHTVLGKGRVMWVTPYANEQYYGKPNKSKLHNPNARMLWFEEAKSRKLKDWVQLVIDTNNRNP